MVETPSKCSYMYKTQFLCKRYTHRSWKYLNPSRLFPINFSEPPYKI